MVRKLKIINLLITLAIVMGTAVGILVIYTHPFSRDTPLSSGAKGYIEIDPQGLEKRYEIGQAINFSVLIRGFGTYPCLPPAITIYNNDDKERPVFSYIAQAVSCPDPNEHYSFYFPDQNGTFSTRITQSGNYTLYVSLGKDSYQRQFSVISNDSMTIR